MPWKETRPVDQRVLFLAAYLNREGSVQTLATRFGVSRKTANKWLARYRQAGTAGLNDRTSRPQHPANELTAAVKAAILTLRTQHPSYGPKKLHALLARQADGPAAPSASSIARVLKGAGITGGGRRTPRPRATPTLLSTPTAPNQVWAVDFKGKFPTGDGRWCSPLTIMDVASRYLLACVALTTTDTATVQPHFAQVFTTAGLPARIRSDNGPPFASTGLGGLTPLAVWWCRLGIQLERITPGHPQQNGVLERFHRTLKQDCPIGADCADQQRLFDAYRHDYNHQRPHEALGDQTPAGIYEPATRILPAMLPELTYASTATVRMVRPNGGVRFQGAEIYLTPTLVGETVGIEPVGIGHWVVRFGTLLLGWLHEPEFVIHRQRPDLPVNVPGGDTTP